MRIGHGGKASEEIFYAFVFTSFGDHHAGRNFYGGMCYFNGAALAMIQDAAALGRLPKAPHLGMLLFRWLGWGKEEDVREYVKGLVETDDGLLDFLVGFLSQVYSTSGNYKVIRHIVQLLPRYSASIHVWQCSTSGIVAKNLNNTA